MAEESLQIKMFLSHSHFDEKLAEIIHNWIEETFHGFVSIFRSSDHGKSIVIGDDILRKIKDALSDSAASIVLLSRASMSRPWINIEFGASWIMGIHIIPLCLPGLEPKDLPFQFKGIKVCDLSSPDSCIELLQCLLERVRDKYDIYKMRNNDVGKHGKRLHREINRALKGILKPEIPDIPPPSRLTVWIYGSYSNATNLEKKIINKIIDIVPCGLAKSGVRLVVGQSDMLHEIADKYRNEVLSSNEHLPNPIILPGKLRQRNLRHLFMDAIGTIPDLAILMGGGKERGRVQEEYDSAIEAQIPVLAIPSTGGVAKIVTSTADKAIKYSGILQATGRKVDAGDLAKAVLKVVEAYQADI